MADFQDYFTDPQYIGGFNAIREHDRSASDMGVVYVEDNLDISFWRVFVSVLPRQYTFQTATQGTTGKRALEKLYAGANIKALVAVDSDYDFIKANYQQDHAFNINPCILHTFGFSRESAVIEQEKLNAFVQKCQNQIHHQVNLVGFIEKLSQLAWLGLLKYITADHSENLSSYEQSDFHDCFKITNQDFVTDELLLDNSPLELVAERLTELFSNQHFDENDLHHTEKNLLSLGINPKNAYRFICGHTLDDLIAKIFKQTTDKMYELETKDIKQNFAGKEIKHRLNQLKNSFDARFSLETFFTNYPINHNDEIHQLILQRVQGVAVD